MEKLLILCILLTKIYEIECDGTTFTGIIGATVNSISLNYTWNSSAQMANLAYRSINDPKSNVLMVVSTTSLENLTLTPQILSQYYLQNNFMLSNMDLQSCISGTSQIVNLHFSSSVRTIYIVLFNLDLPVVQTIKSYELFLRVINFNQLWCKSCPFSTNLNPNLAYCQCSPCANNYYGPACQYFQQPVQQETLQDKYIQSEGNYYFRIINPPSVIDLYYTLSVPSSGIVLYMQYEMVLGHIAGYLNTVYDSNHVPFSKVVTSQEASTRINTNNRNISLTITCTQCANTIVTLYYKDPTKTTSKMPLVLGISISSMLFVLIIILIVCLCKKKAQHRIKNTPSNQYFLTTQEIDKYFPSVQGRLVLNEHDADISYEKLNLPSEQSARKQIHSIQCTVCLCDIKETDQIRVAYCRHYFHSACLVGWFAKNQNCPVCRKDCNRDETQEQYQKIKKNKGKLKGKQLVQTILDFARRREIVIDKQLYPKNECSDSLSFEQSCNRQHANTLTKIKMERIERQSQTRNGPQIITVNIDQEEESQSSNG